MRTLDNTVNDLIIQGLRQIYPQEVLDFISANFHSNSDDKHASKSVNSTIKVKLPVYAKNGKCKELSDRAVLTLSLFGNFPIKGQMIDLLFDYAVGEPVHNAMKKLSKGRVTAPNGLELPSGYYHDSRIAVRARMKEIGPEELSELTFTESNLDLVVKPQTYFVIDIVNSDPKEPKGFTPAAYEKIKQRYEDLKTSYSYEGFLADTEARLKEELDEGHRSLLEEHKANLEEKIAKLRRKIREEGTREDSAKGKQGMGLGGTIKFVKEAGGFVKYSNAQDGRWHDGSVKNGLAPGEQGWWKDYDGAHVRIYLPAHVLVDFDYIHEQKTQAGRYRTAGNTQKIMRGAIAPIPVSDDVFGDALPADNLWPDDWQQEF
ncbi:hypothetical protein KY329_00310 [Candidatus Woesearchaeota archaeon]|nr:hypothetical protein [Candidatus Woesearchaeota archaeon]